MPPPQKTPTSTAKQTKQVHYLCEVSVMLRASDAGCSYHLHNLLTDTVYTRSHSTELAKILAPFGVTAGRDTHACYRETMIERRQAKGLQKDILLDEFFLASVDNIDKNQPGKQMSCEDSRRGMHGTSVQHVNPLSTTRLVSDAETPSQLSQTSVAEQDQPVVGVHCQVQSHTARDSESQSRWWTRQEAAKHTIASICESHLTNISREVKGTVDTENRSTSDSHASDAQTPAYPSCESLWYNRSQLVKDRFLCNDDDHTSMTDLNKTLFQYFSQEQNKPGLKAFFSNAEDSAVTEDANIVYLGVLDRPADNKYAIKHVPDCLYSIYGVGRFVKLHMAGSGG